MVGLGPEVQRWKLGDQVMGLVVGGGYAQFCPLHESHALPIPPNLSLIEAAAVPETFFTVWHNVFERGALKPGETLLVHGGSSGIGTAAIQLAKAIGARVITTAGTAGEMPSLPGARRRYRHQLQDRRLRSRHQGRHQGHGADVILDMVGGDYIERNYEAAAVEGRVVQIAFAGSPKATVDFRRIMLKRLHHTGSTLRARSVEDKAAIARAVEQHALPLIAAGRVKPVIDSSFALADAALAHARMESSVHIGKIVLTL